jgi:hypothetical protein
MLLNIWIAGSASVVFSCFCLDMNSSLLYQILINIYSQMDSSSQAIRDDAYESCTDKSLVCIFSVCFFYIAYRNVMGQKIWVEKTNVQLCDCSTSNWRYIATPTFCVFCCILLARFEDFNFFCKSRKPSNSLGNPRD